MTSQRTKERRREQAIKHRKSGPVRIARRPLTGLLAKFAKISPSVWRPIEEARILEKQGLSFPKDRKPVPSEAYHDLDHDLTGEDDDCG